MAQERFCSQCGTARQNLASFCVNCGNKFGGSDGQASAKQMGMIFGGILLLTLFIYGGISLTLKKSDETKNTQTATQDEHNHTHPHDPKLEELEKKALEGSAADAMALVAYLVEKGVQDQHYLLRAAEVLEVLLEKHPTFALAHRTLGNLYYDIGQLEKAEVPYRRYLELYPNDANYRTDYGTVLLSMGQTQAAISQYKQAIALFSDHYHATFNLSIAYQKAGDDGLAQEYRDRATEIDRRVGKTLAPEISLATLPDGKPVAPAEKVDLGRYASLGSFFRNHEIVGPKMVGFTVRDDIAVLSVSKFPMEAMPPFARDAFDKRVAAAMSQIEGKASLEIRDSDSGAVLATYPATP